ncbi:ABC transporter ATP-binding protein [Ferrimicrobium sp.]|uniref:ABC transporter ATP-binding protein n=1 Tax=Ferrimicrobium sp. TaxID=2926050 RepID=UPI002623F324|nr:ABC transporter ATP-binding protein [Ferrimicrobium sp.]
MTGTAHQLGIRVTGLVHLYPIPEGDVVALRGVDLEISPGEVVALLGPSGMGKSTLLRLIAGLFNPSAGRIFLGDRDISQYRARELARLRGREVSLVLQGAANNLLGYGTVRENLVFAADTKESRARAEELLETLGLAPLAQRVVRSLSGGQQQMCALAVGMVHDPSVLLVDEPTSQLDHASRDLVVDLLMRINAEYRTTVVIVTHDPHIAQAMPRTITIRDGRVGAEGRFGEEFAVVGQDGTLQLPPHLRHVLPPDSLVKVNQIEGGLELLLVEEDPHG